MKRLGDLSSKLLNKIVSEIMAEIQGQAMEIGKEAIIDAGKKVLADDSVPKADKLKKEILKKLIMKQLGL